jgi:hypothetical protein
MKDPEAVRRRTLELFTVFNELDEPERVAMPVLMDAIAIVEAYRGARHQVLHLPELTGSVDALLRDLEIALRIKSWSDEAATESA